MLYIKSRKSGKVGRSKKKIIQGREKQYIHYYYFHRPYNNDNEDIKDIAYRNEFFKDQTKKINITNCSDPFYLDENGKQVCERKDITNIKYITLGICRSSLRKHIYNENIIKNKFNRCIVHFYIKKNSEAVYVCSGLLDKTLSKINHKIGKDSLKEKLGSLPGYLDGAKNYADYSYKDCDEEYDPLLIFKKLRLRKRSKDYKKLLKDAESEYQKELLLREIMFESSKQAKYESGFIGEDDVPEIIKPGVKLSEWRKLNFHNGNEFYSFQQTQNSCPFWIKLVRASKR